MKTKDLEGQIHFFDLELPPNGSINPAEADIPPIDTPVSKAKVQDKEFLHFPSKQDIPTVNTILKMIEKGLHKYTAHEFLSDLFECSALAISNRFSFSQEREDRYLKTIQKYDKPTQKLITEIFAQIFILLSQQIHPLVGFNDYLGELYMRSATSNSKTGQFFTPYCVSKMCAEVTIEEKMVEEYIREDKILTLNEPTCGAGGMILAATDVLYNKYDFNYSRNLLVVCSDIDSRCVHMTYLQLGLAGIPAIIYKQNTLTLETWERWETPAYIMQYSRFKDCLK